MNSPSKSTPSLIRQAVGGVSVWVDPALRGEAGILVAFSERTGGVSESPYDTLNLAAHVGDDALAVDANRMSLLQALGAGHLRASLVTAEQVHGVAVTEVSRSHAGAGAFAIGGPPPVPESDALLTRETDLPVMLLFADCVPVVLVRPGVPAVVVVHAGWRGAAAGIVGEAAKKLLALPGADDAIAYIGAHVGPCCYAVGPEVHRAFARAVRSIHDSDPPAAACGPLDLGVAVAADLVDAGVPMERQFHLAECTAHNTRRFFSYRAEGGLTGRHAAIAIIERGAPLGADG